RVGGVGRAAPATGVGGARARRLQGAPGGSAPRGRAHAGARRPGRRDGPGAGRGVGDRGRRRELPLPRQGAPVTQLSTLDRAELMAWLTRVTQTIDRSLREPWRGEALLQLRDGAGGATASVPVLAQLALLDDCLRVAHLAIEADGQIDRDELARVTDLIQLAAPKYFAVLPRYESFDEGAPTPEEVERFFVAHRDDTGAFGYAGESTWRGLHLVRLVERRTRNAAPLRELERMLVRI